MTGIALVNFDDFALASDSVVVDGTRGVLNMATKNSYLLRRFLKPNSNVKTFQAGKRIRGYVMFDATSTAQDYHPGESIGIQNPNVLTQHEIDWRFTADYLSWVIQEIELNEGGSSPEARYQQYVDLLWAKEMRTWTSLINKCDSDLGARPVAAQMEAAGGKSTYSLWAFVNEFANGLFVEPDGTAWTTVAGYNPVTYPAWRPQQLTYAQHPATADPSEWDLITAFDTMEMQIGFATLPGKEEFSKIGSGPFVILCSKTGRANYKMGLRKANDLLVSRQDPAYSMPKFSGFDVEYWPEMDTAAVFPDASGRGTATEATADKSGPRYVWMSNAVSPIWHSNFYFKKDSQVMRDIDQHSLRVIFIECWRNLWLDERRRLGIVYPSVDIVAA